MSHRTPTKDITLETTEIIDLKKQLKSHPLYQSLLHWESVRIFMETHVFAVWDFMTLLKSLQASLCSSRLPWLPPSFPKGARLINQIIVDEETDIAPDGSVKSHFQLYLSAMEQMKCNQTPIRELLERVQNTPDRFTSLPDNPQSLFPASVPPHAQAFMWCTLSGLKESLPVRAALFFHGREDIIPNMFLGLLERLPKNHQGASCELLRDYFQRHVTTDHEVHGPLARELLTDLFNTDSTQMIRARHCVKEALQARITLWDGILNQLRSGEHANRKQSAS